MKSTIKSKVVLSTIDIDYENGYHCEYTIKNSKLIFGRFYSDRYKYLYFVDDETLDKLKNTHWSNHHKIYKEPKVTKKWLENFNEFNKLVYIGGGIDGMLAHSNGTFISTPILLDDIFFQCFEHVETTKQECEKIIKSMKSKYIISSNIVGIPSYNQSSGVSDHYTLYLTVKVPDNIYLKILGNNTHLNNVHKKEIVKFLKK